MSKEHAYDAGYRDGSVHYELEHCPACKNVAGLQEALDENASLRERIHKLEMEGSDHFYRMAYAEDANRTLEVENTKLQAENAKLREELDQWHSLTAGIELPEYPVTQFKPKDLERENAKMRELVKDMFNCIRHANDQDWFYFDRKETGCGLLCTVNGEGCGLLVLADRMRELGIEVDE